MFINASVRALRCADFYIAFIKDLADLNLD